ncbi:MAG: hypothetical protein B6245_02875 [Desulfobacteraceae bacterium 4572_88]|nr:MAG: hypothetical protein B6245_02875 [Desulfobacteraceae bacterium 4572_88]
MNGLEAIAYYNGWAISVVGISIVFTGLTMLSIIISQLHKMLDFWDNRHDFRERIKNARKEEIIADISLYPDIKGTARQFKLLTERLGEPFPLPELLELSEKCHLAHPHRTINALLQAKLLVPDDKGYYLWNQKVK